MPGSPETQYHLPCALLPEGPALEQDRHLVLTADERCQTVTMEGLEATLSAASRRQPANAASGSAKPLSRCGPEFGQLEQPADQPPRGWCNDDGARLCQLLETGRQVRRLADHRLLSRRTLR